jgi:cell division protein FtsW
MSIANRISAELKGDRVIWAIVAILALFSILAVYSSASTLAFQRGGGNTERYLIKQVLMLSVGLLITYACFLIHYKRYSAWAPYMLIVIVPLLLFTLFFGVKINDASRWIMLPGIGITFQTSDLAKIALITYVARSISAKQDYIQDFQSAFMPIIVPIILVFLLIAPADLSTASVLFVTCLIMMFIGRVAMKYIFLLIFCGLVSFAGMIVIGKAIPQLGGRIETWTARIRNFVEAKDGKDEKEYEQVKLAKMAIAKGGFIGSGPGNSVQKNYLPMAYTDYIYAVVIEEYGLFGAVLLMALFLLLFFRVVRLVTIGEKTFPAMLAMGLTLILVIQALANMAVAVNLVPVMGLPMPMVSMGGTSLWFSCIALGMILSVSKHIEAAREE